MNIKQIKFTRSGIGQLLNAIKTSNLLEHNDIVKIEDACKCIDTFIDRFKERNGESRNWIKVDECGCVLVHGKQYSIGTEHSKKMAYLLGNGNLKIQGLEEIVLKK